MGRQDLETEQKALEINLNEKIYGTFAEIGAGQEVAGYFFNVGASSGTVAKTMSAYDKFVSDDIYGYEQSGRYVCESRLYKMLNHEYNLVINRLSAERPDSLLFAFADTIETLNYHKTNHGQGWMGIRFQSTPHGEPNEMVLHVELLDTNTRLQQLAVGRLGVNMVFSCFSYGADYKMILESLMDNIEARVRIDMVRFDGPKFKDVNNSLVALELVRQKMTNVAVISKNGIPLHVSEFMYKKEVLLIRGGHKPITLRTLDRLNASTKKFHSDLSERSKGMEVLSELTMAKLKKDTGKVDEQDFLDRIELLNGMGQRVMITQCTFYREVIQYLTKYRVFKLGLVLGARELADLVSKKFYASKDGQLLASFGEVFTKNVQFYTYPDQKEGTGELIDSHNLIVPDGVKFLYKHIVDNKQVVDIVDVKKQYLHIYSSDVIRLLKNDEGSWEQMVPKRVAELIKAKNLFGFPCEKVEFDY